MSPPGSDLCQVHPGHPRQSMRHLPGLDGVRGLAILMVMFSHFIIVGGNLDPAVPVHRLMMSGYLGVDLFFVLSGFLITGILIDARGTPNYFRIFYLRRALRIFPLYYGILSVAWLSVVFISPGDRADLTGRDSMAWFWLYASNIGMAVKGDWLNSPTWISLGHFWSLAVEEQFYLVWPLLVFLTPIKWLQRLGILLIVSSPWTFNLLAPRIGEVATYVSTLSRLGVLAAGALLAILWRKPDVWMKLKPWWIPIAVMSGVLLLLERSWMPQLGGFESPLILSLGAAFVGIAANAGSALSRGFFQSHVLRQLGKYSYGLYVYHHALKPVWIHFLWEGWIVPALGAGWAATLLYTLVASALSLILAWLSWTCFEAPILSLKSRFAYGGSGDSKSGSAAPESPPAA